VNDVTLLTDQLEAHPRDDTLALALTDALVESGAMQPDRAALHVEGIREEALYELDRRNMMRLIDSRNDVADVMVSELAELVNAPAGLPVVLRVVRYRSFPQIHGEAGRFNGQFVHRQIIEVGPTWLLAYYRQHRTRLRHLAERAASERG
jgi:hypothetical protein